MLYVGIEVAKNRHDLVIIREYGEILVKNFRYQNTYQGFDELKSCLKQLNTPTSKIQIALEDTGHYAYNLTAFLQKQNYHVFTYIPLLVKEFVKSLTLRKTMSELKELTRYQNRLIHDLSKNKLLYVRLLDIVFPELARTVNSLYSRHIYELLTRYPTPDKLKRARPDSMLKINRLIPNLLR